MKEYSVEQFADKMKCTRQNIHKRIKTQNFYEGYTWKKTGRSLVIYELNFSYLFFFKYIWIIVNAANPEQATFLANNHLKEIKSDSIFFEFTVNDAIQINPDKKLISNIY